MSILPGQHLQASKAQHSPFSICTLGISWPRSLIVKKMLFRHGVSLYLHVRIDRSVSAGQFLNPTLLRDPRGAPAFPCDGRHPCSSRGKRSPPSSPGSDLSTGVRRGARQHAEEGPHPRTEFKGLSSKTTCKRPQLPSLFPSHLASTRVVREIFSLFYEYSNCCRLFV